MKRLCTICARGGSKGVKNKNIRLINGTPLIAYTIKTAQQSGLFDEIAVSSDSEEILKVAGDCGIKLLIKRPDEMATDQAAKLPVIIHASKISEEMSGKLFDTFVDLDCTSPLREVEDVAGAVKLLENNRYPNVITGSRARRSPYFNLVEKQQNGSIALSKKLEKEIVRRQDAPKCYDMNASIYVWNRETLFSGTSLFLPQTHLYEMPEERSIDIDSELDFEFVEFLLKKQDKK